MKVNGNSLRAGNIIEYNSRLYSVVKNEHQKPGKGGAFSQLEIRDIRSGNKDNIRLRAQESVERVRLEQESYQFLYAEEDGLIFMHQQNYEQITIKRDLIGDRAAFLQDGMPVEVESYEGEPLGVRLPDNVTFEVAESEPVVKGQTATTSYKPAILDNGVKVMVPPHIEIGDHIVIKTEDGTYSERAKK